MNAWDNEDCGTQPGDLVPNGQKCLYKVNTKALNDEGLQSLKIGQR